MPLNRRAQVLYLDSLVLLLGIVILFLVAGYFLGEKQVSAQASAYDSARSGRALLSAMAFSRGGMSNSEALSEFLCTGDGPQVNSSISFILNGSRKPGTEYIFFAQYGNRSVWLWSSQESACLDEVSLSIYPLSLPCSNATVDVKYGTWPSYKQVPLSCS
jgi:hypothetical protein